MSTANEFGFEYVYDLARKLTPEEQALLAERLAAPKSDENDGKFVIVTVDTGNPIFTPEDFARFEKNRQELLASIDWEQAEKTRQELMQSMRNLPECTEEDIKLQNEVRESMERWKM